MEEILFDIIYHSIIAIVIAVPMGTLHEYLHFRKAKQLGCKVTKNYRKNETVVEGDEDPKISKQIKQAPYILIIPISIIILLIGLFFIHMGLIMGGGGTLLIHTISYPLEGREFNERHKSKSN